MLLDGKVIVITGGAGLIGQEIVKGVVKEGGTAIIADVDDDRMQVVSKKLSKLFSNDKIETFKLDITSKNSLQECIDFVSTKYEKIDALVNNAYPRNRAYGRHFFEVEYEGIVENLGMNIGGCILSAQVFARHFKQQGYGNIINLASIYGVVAPKFEIYDSTEMTMPVEYAAIKAGVLHLTEYMAKYFKGSDIRVNAISPGGILDGQPDVFLREYKSKCLSKGMLDPVDVIGGVIFLLSDMSTFINGQNIVIDDGFSL